MYFQAVENSLELILQTLHTDPHTPMRAMQKYSNMPIAATLPSTHAHPRSHPCCGDVVSMTTQLHAHIATHTHAEVTLERTAVTLAC